MTTDAVHQLKADLARFGYLADEGLATAIHLAMRLRRPLLLEGEAGAGKTEVAKTLARLSGAKLLRLQCYEGIDSNRFFFCGGFVQLRIVGAPTPHSEGSYPYTTEAFLAAFADVPPSETKKMLETNAATVYRSIFRRCVRSATASARPSLTLAVPLDPSDYPSDSTCNAFDAEQVIKAW